ARQSGARRARPGRGRRPPPRRPHRHDGRASRAPLGPVAPHGVAREPPARAVRRRPRAHRGRDRAAAAAAGPLRLTAALPRLNKRTFLSLRRYRNYRLFFGGQVVSVTGTWMQNVASAWLIVQLTHSSFQVGVLALAQFLPFTLFGLFAGT